MQITRLPIPGLLILTPVRHADSRGFFVETFSEKAMEAAGLPGHFVQDNLARTTHAGTVRGLHFQTPPMAQDKLVQVQRGSIFDVAVDLRQGSGHFGQSCCVELSAEKQECFFIPAGFAHGYCTLVDDTDVFYKVTKPYSPDHDRGILWNDPALAIDWPGIVNPERLSARDRVQPRLQDLDGNGFKV